MLLGVITIIRRRTNIGALLKANWAITLYFSYSLVSLLWSDFTGWGFKRWIRALGELVMVLVVVTDPQPTAALRRLISRVGFVLLPASVLLIKYFPNLGRGYDQWGLQMNTGVTSNKNILGVITFVIALGAVWQVIVLLRKKKLPDRNKRLLAQCTLLLFGINVLYLAHSATSGACFGLGAGLMLVLDLSVFKRRPAAVHVLVVTLLLSSGLILLLGGEGQATKALGRKPDLTGRTAVWKVVIPMAPHPLVGAGFETFWVGPRAEAVSSKLGFTNESHNGYIEVYVNLGLVGVGRAVVAYHRDPATGALLAAYVMAAATYSISEAGFRMLGPMWFFLVLAVVMANRIAEASKVRSQLSQKVVGQPSLLATTARP
jgi:hypothetical protein